jgi:hypothetical protein
MSGISGSKNAGNGGTIEVLKLALTSDSNGALKLDGMLWL